MFLVLGLRPGEMFALRWNDKQGNSLRIDSSITDGMEVETKTEGSDSFVWLPRLIDTELEFWRGGATNATPDAFIFPSSRGTAINTNNFLFRVLKEAGRKPASMASRIKCSGGRARRIWRRSPASRTCRPTSGTRRQDHAGALHQIGAGERSSRCGIAGSTAEEEAGRFRYQRIEPN